MFHLSVLPLTRQLTNISGNLWSKTLQGARAQRVEYLLLHELHGRKYILPDKMSAREKEVKPSKRKSTSEMSAGDVEELVIDGIVEDQAEPHSRQVQKRSSLFWGLVLEPKKGLYDKYILLLDFNRNTMFALQLLSALLMDQYLIYQPATYLDFFHSC